MDQRGLFSFLLLITCLWLKERLSERRSLGAFLPLHHWVIEVKPGRKAHVTPWWVIGKKIQRRLWLIT